MHLFCVLSCQDCSSSITTNIDKTFGEKGEKWLQKCIHLGPKSTDYNVIIEAVRGNDYQGDIAIDDVEVSLSKTCTCRRDGNCYNCLHYLFHCQERTCKVPCKKRLTAIINCWKCD